MMRLGLLCFAVLFAFPALADMCVNGACGQWVGSKAGIIVDGSSMTWTDGTITACTVFAQNPRVSILECDERRKGSNGKSHMLYFLKVSGDHMHMRYAPNFPRCIARASCWPGPGMDFKRRASDTPAP